MLLIKQKRINTLEPTSSSFTFKFWIKTIPNYRLCHNVAVLAWPKSHRLRISYKKFFFLQKVDKTNSIKCLFFALFSLNSFSLKLICSIHKMWINDFVITWELFTDMTCCIIYVLKHIDRVLHGHLIQCYCLWVSCATNVYFLYTSIFKGLGKPLNFEKRAKVLEKSLNFLRKKWGKTPKLHQKVLIHYCRIDYVRKVSQVFAKRFLKMVNRSWKSPGKVLEFQTWKNVGTMFISKVTEQTC